MPRLIWVFAGRTLILLVLTCRGSNVIAVIFLTGEEQTLSICRLLIWRFSWYEPPRDKINNVAMRPAKTQISLGGCPVWSESSLCAQWVAKDSRFLHADSEDSIRLGGCPGWSESSLDVQPHCWFCHVAAHMVRFYVAVLHLEQLVWVEDMRTNSWVGRNQK